MNLLVLLTLVIAALVASFSFWTILNHRMNQRRLNSELYQRSTELLQEAEKSAAAVNSKVLLLVEHTDDYFHSLTKAGFPRLQAINHDLNLLVSDAQRYHSSKQCFESFALCSFLLGIEKDAGPLPEEVQPLTSANVANLVDWRTRSQNLMIECVRELETASLSSDEIRVARNPKRSPTSVSLKQLRDQLIDSPTI